MEKVLEKFRELHRLIQNDLRLADDNLSYLQDDSPFENFATILSEITESNIYILSQDGILLGNYEISSMNNERFAEYVATRIFPEFYLHYLERIKETKANLTAVEESTIFPVENEEFHDGITTIIPMFVSGQRLGNLILGRIGKKFEVEDLILAEYCATIVGIELLHYTNMKRNEEIATQEKINLAFSNLSYSEKKAVASIFKHVDTLEIRITASKIAQEYQITRSVIVNTLRKLESAGLLESQSLGMKGTFIKIKSQYILDEMLRKCL